MKRSIILSTLVIVSIGNSVLIDGLGWFIQQKYPYAAVKIGKTPRAVYESERCKVEFTEVINNFLPNGGVRIINIRRGAMNFKIANKEPESSDFYINTNFFTNDKPIGEVIIDGERTSKKVARGGYFYVKNGRAYVRKTRPKGVEYASQSIMMGIQGGRINRYITNLRKSKEKIWRGMLGENDSGDIIVIHSMSLGMISMKQLCEIGVKAGIMNGIVLDGGSSLQSLIHDHGYLYEYQPVPDLFKTVAGIHVPFVFVAGRFE